MDQLSWPTILVIFTSAILILKAITGRRGRKLNLPPGPKPWPIIGNLNLMGPLVHQSLHELAQKYGPLMHLQFGSHPVVVGSSAEMAKFFLKTHDNIFASRPESAAGKYVAYNYSDIVWSPYGPYLRKVRKVCQLELFTAKRLESYEYIREEEVKNMLRNLYKCSGDVVVMKEYLQTVTFNGICRIVLGKTIVNETAESEQALATRPQMFKEMIDEVFALFGAINIGDYIPWLNFLDLQGYIKRMKAVHLRIDSYLDNLVAEHNERKLAEGEKFVAKDTMDVLLQLADNENKDMKIENRAIKPITQVMIGAGTDTTSVTLEWALAELLKSPHNLERAMEELDRVIGKDRWVEEKDIAQLPFIDAVMKETMRLHPVFPLMVPHLCMEDVTINGYDIAAGTRVLVNVWSVARDPLKWDAPNEFRPERFIGSSIDVRGHDYEILPFGAGRRMCPGYVLAIKVFQITFANLLHGFQWRLPEGMKAEELNMEECIGLSIPRKFPLEAIGKPRLAAHLYGV